MGIGMMIQLALQAATAAISLLRQLGYLDEQAHEQIMMTLVSAHPGPAKEDPNQRKTSSHA